MSILRELENSAVYYDDLWDKEVKQRFCEKIKSLDDKSETYFKQHWQGFAWAAIIGFINNKSISLDSKKNSSFKFGTIFRQGPSIADALILMAIGKLENEENLLEKSEKILEVISEYAKGGAQIIKEIRETPGNEDMFYTPEDFLTEIENRT
jgi:hypothetical protein